MNKRLLYRIVVFVSLFLQGCSAVFFDAPMPVSVKSLPEFSSGLRGRYHLRDSMIPDRKENIYNAAYYKDHLPQKDTVYLFAVDLVIEKNTAYYIFTISLYCKNCSLDSMIRARGNHRSAAKETVKSYDRLGYRVYEKSYTDTVLGKKDKLKLYNKAWYLNHFVSKDKAWEIVQLRADGKGGLIAGLASAKDKGHLKKFVVKEKVFSSVVHLSDNQFYHFVRYGGFSHTFRFQKDQ